MEKEKVEFVSSEQGAILRQYNILDSKIDSINNKLSACEHKVEYINDILYERKSKMHGYDIKTGFVCASVFACLGVVLANSLMTSNHLGEGAYIIASGNIILGSAGVFLVAGALAGKSYSFQSFRKRFIYKKMQNLEKQKKTIQHEKDCLGLELSQVKDK